MKPWLQGRLALSKQTSRFELPMDVKLLEGTYPLMMHYDHPLSLYLPSLVCLLLQ